MTTAGKIPTRSLNGCWTCRVRKKKCDETRPSCGVCISLGIECHGYGPRPEWMDNGVLQKEQASRFKSIVSRGRKRMRSTTHSSEDLNQGISDPLPTRDTVSRDSAYPILNEWNGAVAQGDLLDITSSPFTRPSSSDALVTESQFFFNHDAPVPLPLFFNNTESGQNLSSLFSPKEPSWLSPNLSNICYQEGIGFDMNGRASSNLDKFSRSTSQTVSHFPRDAPYHEDLIPRSSGQRQYVTWGCHGNSIPSPVSPGESPIGGETEDALFMHYLDRVFYVQFPFYHSRDRQGRGWLFSILKRVKPAYFATLALSQRDILSEELQHGDFGTGLTRLRTKDNYYDLAIRGTQHIIEKSYTWNGGNDLVHCIEGLTSILQLLFWELLAGGTRSWQGLLRAAARLIPGLVQARIRSTIPNSTILNHSSYEHKGILSAEEDSATSLLLGSFISFDITSSASTRKAPSLDIDHVQVLNNLGIDLESITGCRNSIMALIHEISALDRWKEESEAARRLSIIDLAERGRQIEDRLRKELASMGTKLSTGLSVCNHAGVPPAPSQPEVSKLFALSAITYLHVVLSGPHPEIPEISEAVSQTIYVFKGLKDKRLLQGILVWPFCISGCLAQREQQSFFRDLFYTTGITESSIGTCFEAFKIMEECWEARRTRSVNYDWVSIMNQRGHSVLLR